MAIPEASPLFDNFPQFDASFFSDDFQFDPSDLDFDLDDIPIDVDDSFLLNPDPNPNSPESASSTVTNKADEVIVPTANPSHEVQIDDVSHGMRIDDVTSAGFTPQLARSKVETGDVRPVTPNSSARIDDIIPSVAEDRKRKSPDRGDVSPNNSAGSTVAYAGEEDEKRKARLMRNRESAQLSRQRRKHYVEELEEKVRLMGSTIAELNGKISFYMAENARLHHQLTAGAGHAAPPYPAPMRFPWVPYPVLPNGALPIPRLKPQNPAPAVSSKPKAKKSRTKKVASVSLLGLFLVFLVFGGVSNFGFFRKDSSVAVNKGKVLSVSGWNTGLNHTNSSESIPALLYVPRNGKRVEINGNLIIHSVLASEKAVAKAKENTGLAISGSVGSALAVPNSDRGLGGHPKKYRNVAEGLRALASDSHGGEKSMLADGPLQQWFSEGLAGPILSSGTCTEVFQFEVSPNLPTTTIINSTDDLPPSALKNRRFLYPHPIPLEGSSSNDTHANNTAFHANSTVPSMVVSVMADPREAGDGDLEGMVTPKSISRIFVVVLMDSVKYVTYSCMLPLKNYGGHLVK